MSRLIILTRPELCPGFQLAGVDAYEARDVENAEDLIDEWLETGEIGLLAIDDGLLERLDTGLKKRLSASETLPHIAIPGGQPLGKEASRKHMIAEMIRRAIGFHITFKGEEPEVQD